MKLFTPVEFKVPGGEVNISSLWGGVAKMFVSVPFLYILAVWILVVVAVPLVIIDIIVNAVRGIL